MAPPDSAAIGKGVPSRSLSNGESKDTNTLSSRVGDSPDEMGNMALTGTKRPRASSTSSADGKHGDLWSKRQLGSGSINRSQSPASSAAIPRPSAKLDEIRPPRPRSNETSFNDTDGRNLSAEDPITEQLVYVGSLWSVETALRMAPSHEAELLARYQTDSSGPEGHKIGLFEAFNSTQPTQGDGRHVGWLINGKFNHADELATLMHEFKNHEIRVISRRKDRSRPFLDEAEPGLALVPPRTRTVNNFKVYCKKSVKDRVAERLLGMRRPGEENIHVEGFTSNTNTSQEGSASLRRVSTLPQSASSEQCKRATQGKRATYPSGQADPRLQAACDSLVSADCLVPSETPAAMTVALREHQQKALSWMRRRERGNPLNNFFVREERAGNNRSVFVDVVSGAEYQSRPVIKSGGILADTMGMGKTVTAVSFILAGVEDSQEWATSFGQGGDVSHSMATLLVVPPPLVGHWEREIRTKTRLADGDVYVYFGPYRIADRAACAKAKIVLTSSSLVSLAGERDRDLLFNTHWYRAMFDEAHEFRNHDTRLAKNVLRIKAKYRWAITGTPVHNYVSDIQPILQLINAQPITSRAEFNELVSRRLQSDPKNGSLVLRVLAGSYMIRRKADDSMFPTSCTHVKAEVTLTQEERQLYEEAKNRAILEIENSTSSVSALSRFHDMRKVCAMGLIAKSSMRHSPDKDANTPAAKYQRVIADGGASCHGCGEVPSLDTVQGERICFILSCTQEHVFCPTCFAKESGRCPCEEGPDETIPTPVTRTDLEELEVDTINPREIPLSAKMRFIRDEVKAYPGSRFVVMASYVSTVSEIIRVLEAEGVTYARYDGSVSQASRRTNMAAFKEESSIQVLVGTIKSLGEGHSVEQARRLILVDVEWNPQVSEQAKARVLRLNQQNDATVTQLIAKGTIEENMWARAEERKWLDEAFSDHWSEAQRRVESDLDVIKSWFRN